MAEQETVDAGAERVCRLVGSLTIPTPWHLGALIDVVARDRGKPIRLIPYTGLSTAGQPCGIWIGRKTDDIIVYDDTTSGYHGEQIILHELGHLLLEHHNGPKNADAVSIQELLPDIDPGTVSHVLGRSAYDSEQESQAELFASLMMSQSRKTHRASR
ncbi:MAG: hypothetical protein JOZ49_07890, partial [Mycolicibacterium sp.]|nr:hypothetical protein [Mycolicibacterium sp.]